MAGSKVFAFRHWLHYLWQARDEHSVHSPFVFRLYTQVIRPDVAFYDFVTLEAKRRELQDRNDTIHVTDFGAPAQGGKPVQEPRSVARIARSAAKAPRLARLLFRLVNEVQPDYMLELGTSLGLTTAYLGSARRQAQQFISLEGCPNLAQTARENLADLGLAHIQIQAGNIDQTLAQVLETFPRLDFVFFDANHRFEPTLRYFHQCLAKAHEGCIFVFDDIYWSPEMAQAWQEIKAHHQVTVTVDLFWVGLVFFRQGQAKEHFTLRF